MAANMELYSNAFVTFDGKLLVQEAQVTVEKKSGLNPVFTVALGLAGMTQGASTVEITIEEAVPSADFEINPDPYMRTGQVVEVGIIMGGRQSVHKCFLTDATFSHGTNDASKVSMKFLGRFADFE